MKKKVGYLFLLLLLFGLISAPSLYAATEVNVTRAVLKNGLRVVIIRNTLAPVATIHMNYLVGANEDPPGFPGTAHAQEHMMFRGGPGLSAEQLSAITAALGGEFNADTQQTITQYTSTVPKNDLDIALHVEAIRMKNIGDSQKLWRRERGAIEQEVAQDLSNPEYVFYTRLLSEIFAGTPYAHDALGSRESFDKMTGRMLGKFHRMWYVPNNAILIIAGDIEPRRTLKMVEHLFGGISSRPVPARAEVNLKPLKAASIKLDTDLPYGMALVAYRLPGYDSPDYAAGQILGDILESKRANIYALVPQGKALSVDVGINALPKAAIGYVSAAFPKGEDGGSLISAMKDVIAGYLEKGFPAELVEAAKQSEIADNEFQKNSIEGLAAAWSQAVANEGRNSPDDDVNAIRRVTVEDVNRVAHTYLRNDSAITALLEPRSSGQAVAKKSTTGKESFAARQVKNVKMPAWAKKADLLPKVRASFPPLEDIVMPNGLRLIVLPENISGTVNIFGRVRNKPELQVPEGREGVERVLSGLFSYGTKTLDRLAFQKALDDIAARESAGTSFSLQVLAEHFDRGAQLLADNLLHPALPEDAFQIVRQQTGGELAGLLQSPSYLEKRALLTALYPRDDPSLRHATPETVARLTLDDVTRFYSKVFRPDMTTIVVIGNVTPDQARAVIGKYFGEWTANGPRPDTDLPVVPLSRRTSAIVPDTSRVQDVATLAETLGITRSDPDYYPLEVGRHVLSGGFYATRLYQDLREKTGLVYSVEAFLQASKHRSVFGVVYACDPANTTKASAIVMRNLKEMQIRPITVLELHQARSLLVRQIPLSQSGTKEIADKLLDLAAADLPLDEPARAEKRYREISAQEIRSAFVRWIRPDDLAEIVLGPNPE